MRFRIDFRIRELDVPAEEARGIAFGDEVDGSSLMDFFDRCRDATRTLFGAKRAAVDLDVMFQAADLEEEKLKALKDRAEKQKMKERLKATSAQAQKAQAAFDEFGARVAEILERRNF